MMREAVVGSKLAKSLDTAAIARAIVWGRAAQGLSSFGCLAHYSAAVASIKAVTFRAGSFDAETGVLDAAALSMGTTKPNAATTAFPYLIGRSQYYKAAVAAGTALGTDVIPIGTFGAVALDINAAGTITAVGATANATGYASAALARAGLPAVAAGYARLGNVTASKSDGAFTFGTTDLDAVNTTVAYTSATALVFTASQFVAFRHDFTNGELNLSLPQAFWADANETLVCELAASGAATTGEVDLFYFEN